MKNVNALPSNPTNFQPKPTRNGVRDQSEVGYVLPKLGSQFDPKSVKNDDKMESGKGPKPMLEMSWFWGPQKSIFLC